MADINLLHAHFEHSIGIFQSQNTQVSCALYICIRTAKHIAHAVWTQHKRARKEHIHGALTPEYSIRELCSIKKRS